LPKELANTVANIYFNYCELNLLESAVREGRITQSAMLLELGLNKVAPDYGDLLASVLPAYTARVKSDYKTINEMINQLRQIDEKENPEEYEIGVYVALGVMKYNIDPSAIVEGNTDIVKQQYQESVQDEIPDLIDLLAI